MGHSHNHSREKEHNHLNHNHSHVSGNIGLAFFLNFSFTIIEFIGGVLTNSVSIISDAVHDLGDSISIGSAWYLQKVSNNKRNKLFNYGYKRLTVLGALINCIVLVTGSIFVLTEAFKRILNPEESHAGGMFLLAIIGIIFNGYGFYKTYKTSSLNERVISLHLLEDVLGWIGVLVVSALIYFTDLYIFDPIFSILITIYILYGVFKNLKAALLIFLQTTPEGIDLAEIEKMIKNIPQVVGVHDLHVWSLDGEKNIMSAHIIIDKNIESFHELKDEIRHELEHFGIGHCTLEIEYEIENCNEFCK